MIDVRGQQAFATQDPLACTLAWLLAIRGIHPPVRLAEDIAPRGT